MLSRPHSPFKRSSRSPSRAGSPIRGFHGGSSRWASSVDESSTPQRARRAFNATAGPSSETDNDVAEHTCYSAAAQSALTRAEHYDVVIEGREGEAILSHLGTIVLDHDGGQAENNEKTRPTSPTKQLNNGADDAISTEKFEAMMHELMQTEKSYVQRIEVLYQRYAVPLRQMARDRDTAIIPLYEAQRLFGNVGEIVGANMTFLRELEQYVADRFKGKSKPGGSELGEIIYRNIACFGCYSEYFGNFEKAKHIEQSMMRSNKSFRDFVERTKYSTAGLGNVGLRELIMEPVQRIPRYTLLLDGLIRNLPPSDPSRARLEQAVVLAGRIASCEVDDKTKRAAVLWSLSRNIDAFPAGLISVHRQFIDCIDVDDFPIDVLGPAAMNTLMSPGGSSVNNGYRTLHCTLILFDDVVAVVKRANADSCGRSLVGLDNLNKLADLMKTYTERSATLKSPPKNELSFRGLIDILDVRAVDMGGLDFQLFFKKPPSHASGDKWAGRPVRQYATVDAVSDQTPDPSVARQEKYRFLDNLWRTQALFKAREHRSHVRCNVIPASASNDGHTRRVVYWNVYSRRTYLADAHKSDVVLHVDPEREADELPFGQEEIPAHACIRVSSVDDQTAFCTYAITFKRNVNGAAVADAGEIHHTTIAQLPDALFRTSKALHRVMIDFDPRQGSPSPKSPSSSYRGRALASGLEQFGRTIFGTPSSLRSSAAGSDFWGGVKRQRSKGSSQFTRNGSTSTRQTYSTGQTSSIASRNHVQRSVIAESGSVGELQASIERYRCNAPLEARPTAKALEEISDSSNQRSEATSPAQREGAVSPSRRKPVPSAERASSTGSKRLLPLDTTPTAPVRHSKRIAHNNEGEDGYVERDTPPSPSPSPARRTMSAHSAAHSVAPLSIRKDRGQERRSMSREEMTLKMQRDLDNLQQCLLDGQKAVELAQAEQDVDHLSDCQSDMQTMQDILTRMQGLFDGLARLSSSSSDRSSDVKSTNDQAETIRLQMQVTTLTRKCELMASLERDGRLENTELHKAFNEELDRMYDDAQLGEFEQIARLRHELRLSKAQRNEANIERKTLQRELALERAQSEVWRTTLEQHGLI